MLSQINDKRFVINERAIGPGSDTANETVQKVQDFVGNNMTKVKGAVGKAKDVIEDNPGTAAGI
jgi:hypothetical protein